MFQPLLDMGDIRFVIRPTSWWWSPLVRTPVSGRQTFPVLYATDGWHVTTLWVKCPLEVILFYSCRAVVTWCNVGGGDNEGNCAFKFKDISHSAGVYHMYKYRWRLL